MIQGKLSIDNSSTSKESLSLWKTIQKPIHVISFNWASILFISFFLAYGYYGAITPEISQFKESLVSSILKLSFLALILVFFGLLAWKAPDRFQDSIKIQKNDFFVFASYFAILFAFSFNQLQFSLYSDEISYSATSHGQGIRISLALIKQIQALDGVSFQYVVQAISLVLLVALLGLFVISKRLTWRSRIIIFLFLLVLGRMAITVMGGNGSPHPPLQLIPPFVFGSVFGITDFSFKFSYFAAYAIFILLLYRMVHRVFSFSASYLLALAAGTIPLLWHLSGVVEHSLWAAICFTLVLVEATTSRKLNYIRLISFISIATMMRQPLFLAIFPVVLLFINEEFQSNDWRGSLSKLLLSLSPTLLFIPFLATSLIQGTPSTDALSESSALGRVLVAINSDIIWTSISSSVPYWWLILALFAFIPLSQETVNRNIIFLLFFSSAIFVYYSIHPSLWGYAKYQAEYAVPFSISGLIFLAMKFSKSAYPGRALAALVSILILLNIVDFVRIPQGSMRTDVVPETRSGASRKKIIDNHFPVAVPYNYHDAYDAIKKANLAENSYSMGATYGILPEIMNGYSIKQVRAIHDIFLKQESNRLNAPNEGWSIDLIERDSRIRVVLLGAISSADKEILIGQFKARRWSVMGEYINHQYGSNVVVMRKLTPASGSSRTFNMSTPVSNDAAPV